MYKVTKRDCPMFGIGPYVCEFICDTASDISTLPTSISEGTGGKTVYDNQKCASGSMAIVADNGAESKQYMLNNQDIWCPYSVAAGSSEHQDLSEYAKKTDVPSIKVNSAVNADTVNGHTVNADVPADAKFTDTVPDLTPYAKTVDVPGIKVNEAVNADTVGGKDPEKIFYDNGISTDLNSATKSGCYGASPDTLNTPLSSRWLVDTINFNDQFIVQKAYNIGNKVDTLSYIRNYENNAWSDWKEISTTPIKTDTITLNSDAAGYIWLPQGNGRKYISAVVHGYGNNIYIDNKTGSTNLHIYDAQNVAVTIDITWLE